MRVCPNCCGDGEWWEPGLEPQDYIVCLVCDGFGYLPDIEETP